MIKGGFPPITPKIKKKIKYVSVRARQPILDDSLDISKIINTKIKKPFINLNEM